jgi:hypothetical protein
MLLAPPAVEKGKDMKLTIVINNATSYPRGDLVIFLREVQNALMSRTLDPDIKRPIRDFSGQEIGYALLESAITWPTMRMDEE